MTYTGAGGCEDDPLRGATEKTRAPTPPLPLSFASLATVLKGGTVIDFEPARVETVDLRIEGNRVVARGAELPTGPGDDVVDVTGRLVTPGLVSGHHHLHATALRGLVSSTAAPPDFHAALEAGRWAVHPHLDLDGVQVVAAMGALEALYAGTTTLVDMHASAGAIRGSLLQVARGMNEVGLRGVLAYEVTDRYGVQAREDGLQETREFVSRAQGRFRGLIGAHASYTLSDEALQGLARAVQETGAGLHIHLAEDPTDERVSLERYGHAPLARLLKAGLLSSSSVVAHAVHLGWPELSELIATGAWIVHNPRSNMEHQVGYAPAGKFGARALVGTDDVGVDVWADVKLAHFRAREASQPIDALRYLTNGHRMTTQIFNEPLGSLVPGALADLLLLDYRPPTELTEKTLASHLLQGMGSRWVDCVMVDGVWRLWARRPLTVSAEALSARARDVSARVWRALAR